MEGVLLRPALPADLSAIQRIYDEAIRDTTATWDEAPWPWEQRLAWWREHEADPTTPVFVAEAGGEVVAFAYLSWYRPKSGYRFTREDTVYVDPAYQGKGLGRALLEETVGAARELGVHVLIASIEATNAASLALHASLGFEPAGVQREVGFKFGRWLDLVVLQLVLPGAP